jgi:hypothetical protein
MGQFPTHPNREFFAAEQGIKSGDQANFRPDQGNPLWPAILSSAGRGADVLQLLIAVSEISSQMGCTRLIAGAG